MILEIIKNVFKKPLTRLYPKVKPIIPRGFRGFIVIDRSKCVGCGLCTRICPTGALKLEGRTVKYYPEKCTFCGLCVRYCPMKAIKQTEEYLLLK